LGVESGNTPQEWAFTARVASDSDGWKPVTADTV